MKRTTAFFTLLSTLKDFLYKSTVLMLLLLVTFSAYADTTGIVGGTVLDDDGCPLIGATVMVEGTSLGTMADTNGEYIIAGVTPGSYSVTASMVGRTTSRVEAVLVIADQFRRLSGSYSVRVEISKNMS